MHFAIKIESESGFTPAGDPLGGTLAPGPDGVIAIEVTGTNAVGVIDPDFGHPGANRELVLAAVLLKFAGSPTAAIGDGVFLVDDAGAVAAELVDPSSATFPFYSDRRWLVPVGYRLRVNVADGTNATLRLNFWVLDDPEQLGVVRPLGEGP